MTSKRPTIPFRLIPVLKLLAPGLEELRGENLLIRLGDIFGLAYSAPMTVAGLVWLIYVTDPALIRTEWPMLLLLLGLVILVGELGFTFFMRIAPRRHASAEGTLTPIVTGSAALLFGPTALWLRVAGVLSQQLLSSWRTRGQPVSASQRWYRARHLSFDLGQVGTALAALALYRRWGGTFPPSGLTLSAMARAAVPILVHLTLSTLLVLPFLVYLSRVLKDRPTRYRLAQYVVIVTGLRGVIEPFALLGVILYIAAGFGGYLFFAAGVVLVSLLARQLSRAALRSRQHARELSELEQLGRAILQTPVTPDSLSQMLEEHLPDMFPSLQMAIRLFPDQWLYRSPSGAPGLGEPVWTWLRTATGIRYVAPGKRLPPDGDPTEDGLVLAPIFEPDRSEPIGGIVIVKRALSPWSADELADSLPAVQTLSRQIGAALHGARLYRMEQELTLAGEIQASFLPEALPEIPGWQVTATLEPARETAGDFYDVIPLPNGRFGLVVADVADKGMGAALYMSLSRTLLRTYVAQYPTRPDLAMRIINRRLLTDTDVTMFVTVFCGILDPASGELSYCNAGHNAPCVVSGQRGAELSTLKKTGMALGAVPGKTWAREVVELRPGDLLVLYSDGLTDAQNEEGARFGRDRLLEVLQAHGGRPAGEVRDGVLCAVRDFTGPVPQFDDMTLMVVRRGGDGDKPGIASDHEGQAQGG